MKLAERGAKIGHKYTTSVFASQGKIYINCPEPVVSTNDQLHSRNDQPIGSCMKLALDAWCGVKSLRQRYLATKSGSRQQQQRLLRTVPGTTDLLLLHEVAEMADWQADISSLSQLMTDVVTNGLKQLASR